MARPRRISDEQILSAMKSAVLEHGPAVSLDVVAGKLEVTSPALLKRFGSREALLLEALRPPSVPEWVAELQAGPSDLPLKTQLEKHFTSMTSFFSEMVPRIAALRESGIDMCRIYPAGESGPEQGLRAVRRWLEQAKKRGLVTISELDTAAYSMMGSLQARAFIAHINRRNFGPDDQRRYVQELARFFTRALAPAPSPARRQT